MVDYGPVPERGRFTVILAAWPLPKEARPDLVLERHDAIRAFTRAVAAVGGTIAVTADSDVAPLIAHVALDYAGGAVAERRGGRSPSPVVVMETERQDDLIRGRVAPFVWRNAVTYLDAEGQDVSLRLQRTAEIEGPEIRAPRRQPLTERFVHQVHATAAVVVSAPDGALEELGLLVKFSPQTVMVGRTIIDSRVRELLPSHDLERWMEQLGHWRHRFVGIDDRRRMDMAIPYAYLAQRLASKWAG